MVSSRKRIQVSENTIVPFSSTSLGRSFFFAPTTCVFRLMSNLLCELQKVWFCQTSNTAGCSYLP